MRGRKLKLSDQRTLPPPAHFQRVEKTDGGWYEISQWDDVRMRQWPPQPLGLYRVWEYRADGTPRYKRPLWVIYVGPAAAPQPAEAQAIYDLRFGIEHSLRFMKGEVILDKAQCNGAQAQDRIALWVEVVASVLWWLFALRPCAQSAEMAWPKGWRGRRLTPGALRRVAVGLFVKLGIHPPAAPSARKVARAGGGYASGAPQTLSALPQAQAPRGGLRRPGRFPLCEGGSRGGLPNPGGGVYLGFGEAPLLE